MSDPVSLASLFDAAEQAAAGGDFAAAARLLAEAARAQEATLGPDHLDLANTLNNLAVAHERSGQLDAAEREYRRAHAIAGRTRPADDPEVTTSAQNLREFCQAHGRPLDGLALVLAGDVEPGAAAVGAGAMRAPIQADVPTAPIERLPLSLATDTPSPAEGTPAPTRRASTGPATANAAAPRPIPQGPAPARRTTPPPLAAPAAAAARRLPIPLLVALGALGFLVVWLVAGRGPDTAPSTPPTAPPADRPAAAIPAPAPPSVPSGGPTLPTAPGRTTAASAPPPAAGDRPVPTASASADGLIVADAQLCTTLSPSYRCDAAGASVRPGRLAFYTRLVAERDTTVVHRWYRGDDLRQSVRLAVPARRQGFRTFSRGTVSAIDGEWRVELRSRDGRLLHTARVTVR